MIYNTKDRPGAEIEVESVKDAMKHLKCDTKIIRNPMKSQVLQSISQSACGSSALICIIMCHGRAGNLTFGDENLSVKDIILAMDNPNLQRKPKVLMLQACRGSERETGLGGSYSSSYDLTCPDMLVVHSSLYGGRAARNVMIPSLAKALLNSEEEEDLYGVVLATHMDMIEIEPEQIPEVRSTLRYRLCLKKVVYQQTVS